MTTILAAIFVFGLLVLVHEFGHFATAKLTGMRVDEFAIGFGPKLFSYKYGETLYAVRLIPLGGFNRIAGMDYEIIENIGRDGERNKVTKTFRLDDEDAGERAYFRKPLWARMIVILAGSIMNFILPVFIFFGIFYFSGVATPSPEPVIGTVIENHPAAMAGLKAGDKILTIDGKPVETWEDITKTIQPAAGRTFKVTYQSADGVEKAATLIPEEEPTTKRAVIGITSSVVMDDPGFTGAIVLAVKKVIYVLTAMVGALVQLVQGTGAAELSGPVGVAQMAGEVAQQGILPLLSFAAFLSLNLGLINLLPVPALDGGHFVMLLLEGLRGKPLGPKAMYYIQATGVVLLVSLMIFTTFKDIAR